MQTREALCSKLFWVSILLVFLACWFMGQPHLNWHLSTNLDHHRGDGSALGLREVQSLGKLRWPVAVSNLFWTGLISSFTLLSISWINIIHHICHTRLCSREPTVMPTLRDVSTIAYVMFCIVNWIDLPLFWDLNLPRISAVITSDREYPLSSSVASSQKTFWWRLSHQDCSGNCTSYLAVLGWGWVVLELCCFSFLFLHDSRNSNLQLISQE